MKMEEINLSQLVVYQQEEEIRKNKSKRKVLFYLSSKFIKLFLQKVRAINGPTIKTISRLRLTESNADNQVKKVAAPMVEEISNLIPDYAKKVNVKVDNF